MQRRRALIGVTIALVAVGVWYAFRPERLFVDRTVNESFDAMIAPASDSAAPAMAGMSTTGTTGTMDTTNAMGAMMAMSASADHSGSMSATDGRRAAVQLSSGRFHSGAHETRGLATIYRLSDGSRVLRLTGFATSNGPDVRVYLVRASDATDAATVKRAGYVELGLLKGNRGDQNYEIPADLDLSAFRTVTIWCKRFSVNFGSAPLRG